jgi:hypothetical protein
VFENRMLRRIFGPKRDEVTGGWRKLHNEELLNLYSSPSIIRMIKSRRMRCVRNVACTMKKINTYTFFLGKSERKRPLGISRRTKLDNNIKMDIRDIVFEGMNWIHLAQDKAQWRAIVNMAMNSVSI